MKIVGIGRVVRSGSIMAVAGIAAITAGTPDAHSAPAFPSLRLFASSTNVTVTRYGTDPVFLSQLGVYVTPVGGTFDLHVGRANYDSPVLISQVSRQSRRTFPADMFRSWGGMPGFFQYTVADATGATIRSRLAGFCPDSWNEARVDGSGPLAPTFPTWCGVNPFAVGIPWGIDQGWGVNPFPAAAVKLPDGTYTFTVSIASPYRELFGISAADDSTTLRVTVATAPATPVTGRRPAQAPRSFGPVPTTTNPPNRARPDLIPLPAWSIGVQRQSGRDLLGFGATIWVGGNGPLEVEGYRQPNSNVMSAFQYFLDGTRVVGRAPAGTFQWDSRPGHNHWHFEQFANYSLIDPATGTSVRSMKQSFCIAPTDALDLLLPHASMDGSGLWSQCGDPAAIWIREALPVGWGDTYFQSVAGQAFDITNIPNGTYQIAVTANPERLLYESNTGNDTSIRQVTLGGTPGHRTVTVAPWHGIMA